jgi:hypothetical protein
MMLKHSRILMSILAVCLMAVFAGGILAGESMKIVGTVNDDGQIVDDSGAIFEIGENDKSDEVANNSGTKVEVVGMVEEDGSGNKTIMIESFKVLE